jgi:hypothetical protein
MSRRIVGPLSNMSICAPLMMPPVVTLTNNTSRELHIRGLRQECGWTLEGQSTAIEAQFLFTEVLLTPCRQQLQNCGCRGTSASSKERYLWLNSSGYLR